MKKVTDGSLTRAELTRARELLRAQDKSKPTITETTTRVDQFGQGEAANDTLGMGTATPPPVRGAPIAFSESADTARQQALDRLSKLIRQKNGEVSERDVHKEMARLSGDAAQSFADLYQAVETMRQAGWLDRVRTAETLTPGLVVRAANHDLLPQDERRVHRLAATEAYRLFNRPGVDDVLHAQLAALLGGVHQLSQGDLAAAEARPALPPLEEDQRRANAILAMLYSDEGQRPELKLPDELKLALVTRLGESGDSTALPLLERLAAANEGAALGQAARTAAQQIDRAMHLTIVSATMEAAPFSLVGGLSNVMGAEPQALTKLGHRAIVITPRHASVDVQRHGLTDSGLGEVTLDSPDGPRRFRLLQAERDGVTYYFVEDSVDPPRQPLFSNRFGVYNDQQGPFGDDPERFEFFSRAVVAATKLILKGEQPDVLQANDSQTALVPFWARREGMDRTGTLTVIHNLAYQSQFDGSTRGRLMVGRDPANDRLFYPMGDLEFYGKVNFLKMGLTQSDGIETVSNVYRDETLNNEDLGAGMKGVLATRAAQERYFGRMNGVDLSQWDPATDPRLPFHFDENDLSGKAANKKALLESYGMKDEPGVPLLSFVGRLDPQKGFDDILAIIERSVTQGPRAKFVVMGTGQPAIMERLTELAKQYPDSVAYDNVFKPDHEHRVNGSSDFYLMPSRFEPCGQPQLYALSMGTIPLVRATGGLDESVQNYDPKTRTGNGFKFTGDDAWPMFEQAMALYAKGPEAMRPVINNAMASAQKHSWAAAAEEQAAIYRRLLKP